LTNLAQGQNMRWYLDKPITKADSVAIIKNNVKSVSNFDVEGDSLYPLLRKTYFYFSKNKIDSVVCPNSFPVYRTIKKITKDKIVETVTMKPGKTKNSNTVCRRIHYFDKSGQVIRTENKIIKGVRLEGEAYVDVYYKYKDGLLFEAYTCGGGRKSIKSQCDTIRYNYEFIKTTGAK
jgi:hypothetical protein